MTGSPLQRAVFAAGVLLSAGAACGPPGQGPNPDPFMPPNAAAAPVDTVTAGHQDGRRMVDTEEMLRGRIAGVEVIQLASGGISVRIRGAYSAMLSTEPLYVVDGIPVHAAPGGTLTWLSPRDVQRIEVLKDPAQTAFYGMRGANGVVLITTKH